VWGVGGNYLKHNPVGPLEGVMLDYGENFTLGLFKKKGQKGERGKNTDG